MDAYSKMTERFGDVGAGQLTKMVNQICIVGAIQSISEGLYFAKTAGLDAKKVAGLVSQGAGGSWQLANRADTMIDNHFTHGFAVDWMRKDLGIALEQGKDMGLSLPVTALVGQPASSTRRWMTRKASWSMSRRRRAFGTTRL
jgi:3-hydroxyisobutyrate dehydrogenase